MKRFITVSVAILALAGAVTACEVPEDSTASADNGGKGSHAKAAKKAISVKAAKIINEFDDNELAADSKYKGKMLRISGVVDEIDTDIFDDEKYILSLGGGGDFEIFTVDCHDMTTNELSTIDKGDTVTVIGEFDDGGDLGVDVKNCALA